MTPPLKNRLDRYKGFARVAGCCSLSLPGPEICAQYDVWAAGRRFMELGMREKIAKAGEEVAAKAALSFLQTKKLSGGRINKALKAAEERLDNLKNSL